MIEAHNHVLGTFKPRAPARDADAAGQSAPIAPASAENADSSTQADGKDFKLFGKDGFDFFDLIDVVNPLQHIPVISTIYRRMTGDELSPGSRIAGATLFGGPIGAALAMADSAIEYKTGKDTGANIYAALFGNEGPIPAHDTMVASVAAPWQDPDQIPLDRAVARVGGNMASAFVASAAPDLGALADFTTGAGGRAILRADAAPRPAETIDTLEPNAVAAPWKNPDLEPLDALTAAMLAQMNDDTLAIEAEARRYLAQADALETTEVAAAAPAPVVAPTQTPASVPTSAPAPAQAERPMPSDAAKAQAINALAAMPTAQTSAAVAELAMNEPRSGKTPHMVPPAADIPRGAGAPLARSRMKAYANSMAAKRTPEQIASAQAAEARANAIMAANANATGMSDRSNIQTQGSVPAQNDWMLDSMSRAMSKYEAGAKLRNASNGANVSVMR